MPEVIRPTHELDKRRALGRGLSALIPDARKTSEAGRQGLPMLPLDVIRPDGKQPRKYFADTDLDSLAQSILQQGLLQPVVVRRDGRGYRLIAGERRWRAAQRAGLKEIPAVIREASDAAAFELALVENLQRSDLTPLEEADGYRRLMDERKWTQEQVAERIGKDRSTVANTLRLLALPEEVKQLLNARKIEMGHARALLSLGKSSDMSALARACVAEALSVRALEARVRGLRAPRAPKAGRQSKESPEARRMTEDLQRKLGTKVRILDRGNGRGSVEIEYFSYEDLDRIVAVIRR